ncbi:pinopsin-like [Schistocerca serialis cubense]|uniref:pinopsin-like n=1 Tax=Schistocerca serialis cubense TaxID=2023355 RepID=UPI00214E711B|nr:pinopsin-like [Schistocerca serialis cubense]
MSASPAGVPALRLCFADCITTPASEMPANAQCVGDNSFDLSSPLFRVAWLIRECPGDASPPGTGADKEGGLKHTTRPLSGKNYCNSEITLWLWTPLNVILFNLVCSDFSVALLGNPLTLAAAVAHRWIFGRTMCVIYGFFMSLLGISSIATLTVLAFERYVMISRPFQARRLSRRGAALLVAAIWLYSLLLTAPPLLGWGDYVHEAANISCSVNWESRTLGATSYIVFLFAMGLVVPVAVISFSYLNIVRTLKKNTLRSGRATRAESRVALMVAVMIAAFLLAWTPYSALALLIAFGDHRLVSPGLAVVPALVAKSSICYNPLIYVGLNTQQTGLRYQRCRASWQLRSLASGCSSIPGEAAALPAAGGPSVPLAPWTAPTGSAGETPRRRDSQTEAPP